MEVNNSRVIKDVLGNGLAATQDLDAGEPIIRIANPYIVVVEKAALDKVCSQCLAENEDLKRCTRCKVARYCSTGCQTEAWKLIHQKECPILKKLPAVPPTPVRALIHILLGHKFGVAPDPRWENLEAHIGDLKKSLRWDEVILQAKAALSFAKCPVEWSDVAIGVLCRMACNAFRVTIVDNTPVGLCFESTLSLANHSCTPNASIIFSGRSVTLRALNPIKEGEQIFISYIDPTSRKETRQAELQERYFFTCNCPKCVNDFSPYESWQKYPYEISNPKLNLLINPISIRGVAEATANSGIAQKITPNTYTNIQNMLERARRTPDQVSRLKWLSHALLLLPTQQSGQYARPPYPAIVHEIYLYHLDNTSFPSALILLLFIYLICDVFAYPQPHHPMRVIRLFTVAKLLKHIASLDATSLTENLGIECREAMQSVDLISAIQSVLILVAELAPLSHGKESRFMRTVESELREVEEVQRLRGTVGDALKQWGIRGDEAIEGMKYAKKVFDGLKILGKKECAEEVMAKGIKLTEARPGDEARSN